MTRDLYEKEGAGETWREGLRDGEREMGEGAVTKLLPSPNELFDPPTAT